MDWTACAAVMEPMVERLFRSTAASGSAAVVAPLLLLRRLQATFFSGLDLAARKQRGMVAAPVCV